MMTGAAAMGVGIVAMAALAGGNKARGGHPSALLPEAGPMVQARGAVSYPAMIAMVSLSAGVAILPPHDR